MENKPATPADDVSDVFEIRDEQIDVAAIMAEVRARLRERRPLTEDLDALVFRPGGSAFASLEEEVRYYLDQARAGNERLLVGEQLRAARTRPLDPVRRLFHQLVQYYVDALAQRQRAVNADVLNALAALLHHLTALADEQQRTVAGLRAEIDRLRQEALVTAPAMAPATDPKVMAVLASDGTTKSWKIRALRDLGLSTAVIAKTLALRYQHVYNVLNSGKIGPTGTGDARAAPGTLPEAES